MNLFMSVDIIQVLKALAGARDQNFEKDYVVGTTPFEGCCFRRFL